MPTFILPNGTRRIILGPPAAFDATQVKIIIGKNNEMQLVVWGKSVIDRVPYIARIMTVQSNGDITGYGKNFIYQSKNVIFEGNYTKSLMDGGFKFRCTDKEDPDIYVFMKESIKEGEEIEIC